MKILQLNTWTGRIKGTLLEFFKNNDFDVICLQEAVWSDNDELLQNFCVTVDQIQEASGLKYSSKSPNWKLKLADNVMEQGNVILSKDKITVENIKQVHGNYGFIKNLAELTDHAYTLQMVKLSTGLTVVNHHGYWLPTPIGDQTTIDTMKKVAKELKKINGPIVMCGDLNIIHDSPAMRELDFLRDLTSEYHIDNTLAGLKFTGKVACDHILVSSDIEVKDFKVLDELVSDHKALVVEIN